MVRDRNPRSGRRDRWLTAAQLTTSIRRVRTLAAVHAMVGTAKVLSSIYAAVGFALTLRKPGEETLFAGGAAAFGLLEGIESGINEGEEAPDYCWSGYDNTVGM